MKPLGHALVSLGLGGVVAFATAAPMAVPVALAVGVLTDLDHLWDFYRRSNGRSHSRVRVVLHSFELAPLLVLLAYWSGWHPLVVAGVVAYVGHLLSDQIANGVRPFAYFFVYRLCKRPIAYSEPRGMAGRWAHGLVTSLQRAQIMDQL